MPYQSQSDDSDRASFSDEYSPTDGYFSDRLHPRDVYIDVASSEPRSLSKASEADLERSTGTSSSSPVCQGMLQPRGSSNEVTPLMRQMESNQPPPAYYEGPFNQQVTYNTMLNEPAPSQAANPVSATPLLGAPRPLQDMGGFREPFEYNSYQKYPQHVRNFCSGRLLKIVLLLCAAIVAACLASGASMHKDNHSSDAPREIVDWPPYCTSKYHTTSEDFDFGTPHSFSIQELLSDPLYKLGTISGTLHVMKAPKGQKSGLTGNLVMATPDFVEIEELRYVKTDTSFQIKEPIVKKYEAFYRSVCLRIELYLYVSPGVRLEKLTANAHHLSVQIYDGVDIEVTNETTIQLDAGSLDAHPFRSREITIDLRSGAVTGRYALMDLLSIKTKSGMISVDVEPKEADKDHPTAAVFRAESLSGLVKVDFDTFDIPARDYKTAIVSRSGLVSAVLIHGSSTDIKVGSGSITADIIPFEADAGLSTLNTNTRSGMTKVTLKPPYKNPGTAISRLTSSHTARSGAMVLHYPQEWEGAINGGTHSGSLTLYGEDVEIIHFGGGYAGKTVKAKKGRGNSTLEFDTWSGSVEVTVGST
ncbi:hypothetical protein BU16DRAFT_577195 [Lophium mytilinum]|uniref:Adhesin domain-containing protein n=1 Tax=Lophium mytilinum TaxID=390894 RepID=A0A6A6RG99_9PEZI|nr:hypothetical protein BU16DRAFT_577195 [Lophium mytilinum]